jgi:ribosome-binding factor A
MPREFLRSRRVEEQIQRILSDVLRQGARDPRLRKVIITAVKASRDLSVARVYATSLEPQHTAADVIDALERARGFLRSAVAAELTVRHAPELRFEYDDSARRAEAMDELIARAVDSGSPSQGDSQADEND